MSVLSSNRRAILATLRDGALNPVEIEALTNLPPYTVRAELRSMKRERLVAEEISDRGHLWELTVRGCCEAWSGAQLALGA